VLHFGSACVSALPLFLFLEALAFYRPLSARMLMVCTVALPFPPIAVYSGQSEPLNPALWPIEQQH